MRFHIQTFGCRVNMAESTKLALDLKANGLKDATLAKAELLIINSCAVTQKAAREVRQLINQAKKINPKLKIWLTGCCATLWQKNHSSIKLVDRLISNQEKDKISLFFKPKLRAIKVLNKNSAWGKFLTSSRLIVKVQDGCDYFCTYCIVPYLRGLSVSEDIKTIVNYINSVSHKTLVNEVVLTGINLGLYQTENQENFTDLIKTVLTQTSIPKISFGSLYTENLTSEFLKLYQTREKNRLTRYFHVPVQSGSDKILKLMRRRYNLAEFTERIQALARSVPDGLLATDVIVGFYEETDTDFAKTYEFLKESPFVKAHIFTYSKREFTSGFYLQKKLSEPDWQTKKKRSQVLHNLFKNKQNQFKQNLLGQKMRALIINSNEKFSTGLLDNGLAIFISTPGLALGFVNVKIEAVKQNKLLGKLI